MYIKTRKNVKRFEQEAELFSMSLNRFFNVVEKKIHNDISNETEIVMYKDVLSTVESFISDFKKLSETLDDFGDSMLN